MEKNFIAGEKFLFATPGFEYQIPKNFEFFATKQELDAEAKKLNPKPHWHPLIQEELARIGKLPWFNYDVYIRIR
jgi:hypothetical protein